MAKNAKHENNTRGAPEFRVAFSPELKRMVHITLSSLDSVDLNPAEMDRLLFGVSVVEFALKFNDRLCSRSCLVESRGLL